jgi:hypothetical protein
MEEDMTGVAMIWYVVVVVMLLLMRSSCAQGRGLVRKLA